MRFSKFLVCVSSLLVIGCGNDTPSSPSVAGTYIFAGTFDSLNTQAPIIAQPYPFLSATGRIDSMHDAIVLNTDGTYQETGGVWGSDAIQTNIANLIEAHGTYTLSGSGNTIITLNFASGSNVSGGIGTIQHDTLAFARYPGAWKFKKT